MRDPGQMGACVTVERLGPNREGATQRVRLTVGNWLVIVGMVVSLGSGGLVSYIAMRDRIVTVEGKLDTAAKERFDMARRWEELRREDKQELIRRLERIEDSMGRLRIATPSERGP